MTVEPKDDGSEAPTTYLISDTALGYIFSDARNAVSVTAIAKDQSENSQQGDITYVTDAVMSSALSYADGTVTWDYALAASEYTIELDGAVVATVSGTNTYDITFTHSGESEIKVYFDDSSFASLTVYTYAVIFDVRGYGEDTPDTLYVVKGEKVTTPEPDSSAEYVAFSGWYTLPDEFDPNAVGYTGFGREFVSGTRFDGNSTLVLYACWTAEKAEMALDAGEYGFTDEPSALAPYGTSDYTLPVPELSDTTKVFLGWYSEEDGNGTRYTDENGEGLVTVTGSAKLYAKYGTAVTLSLTTFEGEDVLEAKKGGDIQYVRDGVVTVPATYEVDGAVYEVAVLNSNAFYNSKYIYTLNIPDTMKYVSVVNNGYSSGTGAFSQSPNIEAVNVYVTGEGPDPLKDVRYYSSDGVLYCKNPETCEVSLVYYPQGRTSGKCVIPECVFNETECELVEGSPDTYLPVYNAVTTISAMVFSAHPCLESVTIPATVTSIESQAFYNCKSLVTVTMLAIVSGGEVEAADTLIIADDAFTSCSNLTEVTLASRLVSFDSGLFSGCTSLTDVNVSATGDPDVDNYSSLDGVLLNASGNEILYYPAARTEFLIADGGITEIGPYAVSGNTNIGSAVIPARIQLIGEGAFYGCTGLTELVFESLGDFNALPLTIGEKAFYGCTGLTSVCLPENLVSLGRFVFGGCSSLTYVSFDAEPETSELDFAAGAFATDTGAGDTDGVYYVTTVDIGPNAPEVDLTAVFGPYLSVITVDDENPNYDMSVEGLVMNSSGTKIIYCLAGYEGAVVIPEGITGTGNVFREKSITSVTIPASLHTIEDDAFRDCKNLAEVIFAEGRDGASLTVGDRAFYGCDSLTSIDIPRGLVVLGDRVFYGCSALASVTLPEGLESIGDYVFYNCSSLSYLYLPSTLEKMGTEDCGVFFVFYGCKALATICISEENPCFACENGILYGLRYDETSETYVGTEVYRAFAGAEGDVILSSSVEKIWYRAFYQSTGITTFSYEGAVARLDVGENAFSNCTSLTSASLPEGLTELSLEMFESCSALVFVCLPESLTAVGSKAFYNCSSLPSLTIPDGVVSIGEYAFYRCTSLESVVFPDNLKTVGDSAFESCTSLESVVIPDAVTAVGDKAFYKCTSLFSVTLGKGVETLGGYAFSSCSKLETLSIDCDVTSMGIWAFADCKSLKFVTLSGDVTSIGASAFRRCTSLVSVAVTGDVSSIEANAFCDCTSLEYVVLPASLTSVEDAAFSGCSSLESVYFLGTADEWNGVSVVGRNNGELTSAEIYLYSESEPVGDGNFWHFVDGKPAIWTKD